MIHNGTLEPSEPSRPDSGQPTYNPRRQEELPPLLLLYHFFNQDRDEDILRLLETRRGSELYDLAPNELDAVFARCPEDLKLRHPHAWLAYLHDRTLIDETGAAAAEILRIKVLFEADPHLPERRRILGEIALIESFFYFNDIHMMSRYHRKAILYLDPWTSQIFGPDMIFTFGAASLLYLYHRTPGGLDACVETVRSGLWAFVQASGGCGAGGELLFRAEQALETGNWRLCAALAERAEYKAGRFGQESILLGLCFLRLRLSRAQGDRAGYAACHARLLALRAAWESPLLQSGADLALGYLARSQDECPAWVWETRPDGGSLLLQCLGWRDIVFGRVLLRQGRSMELDVHGEIMLSSRQAENHVMVRLYGHLYRAAALSQDLLRSRAELLRALELAEPDGLLLPFAELGQTLIPLVKTLDLRRPFYRKVLRACQDYDDDFAQSAVSLTAAEIKVAQLVVRGYKRPEIAQRLRISPNTVKAHLLHLHQKLGASTRAELVERFTAYYERTQGRF